VHLIGFITKKRGIGPLILNLSSIRWKWMANFTPQPL